MTDDNEEIVVGSESPGVGERLKATREAKKITISEAAAQLRLSKETIVNLETEQWELLHGRAYARGYFASYVKFLGLPERELLSAFNVEYKVTEATMLSKHQLKSASKFPWLPVILFVLVLASTWFAYQQWQSSQIVVDEIDNASPWEQLDQQQSENDAFNASVVKPLSEPIENVVPVEKMEVEPAEQEAEQQISSAELIVAEEIERQIPELAETQLLLPEQEVETALIVEQQNQIDQELAQLSVDEEPELGQPPTIELQFSGESWVEIKDAEQQTLLNKMMKADESVTVSGKLPLDVTLGRSSVVVIKYNNVVFDTSPYTQGGVARFVIEEET